MKIIYHEGRGFIINCDQITNIAIEGKTISIYGNTFHFPVGCDDDCHGFSVLGSVQRFLTSDVSNFDLGACQRYWTQERLLDREKANNE